MPLTCTSLIHERNRPDGIFLNADLFYQMSFRGKPDRDSGYENQKSLEQLRWTNVAPCPERDCGAHNTNRAIGLMSAVTPSLHDMSSIQRIKLKYKVYLCETPVSSFSVQDILYAIYIVTRILIRYELEVNSHSLRSFYYRRNCTIDHRHCPVCNLYIILLAFFFSTLRGIALFHFVLTVQRASYAKHVTLVGVEGSASNSLKEI